MEFYLLGILLKFCLFCLVYWWKEAKGGVSLVCFLKAKGRVMITCYPKSRVSHQRVFILVTLFVSSRPEILHCRWLLYHQAAREAQELLRPQN